MQKIYRLKKAFQFNYIYKSGSHFGAKEVSLIIAKNRNRKLLVGFSVSKKVGKAVVRNKAKRRLKEAFRKEIPNLNFGYNYVLVARNPITVASFADIEKSVKYLLRKSKCLNEASANYNITI